MNHFQPLSSQMVYAVKPSHTDPNIHNFDDPSCVIFNKDMSTDADLVVFLPGTAGKPRNAPFFTFIASLGYPLINLAYNNEPAVVPTCYNKPGDCAAKFRADRIYGGGVSELAATPTPETIVNRLTKLLMHLDEGHPPEHWGHYLADGKPNWSRIVIAGFSQGAGMAAYIAKENTVARVVLFSSPWDFVQGESGNKPATWLHKDSVTPMDRWYAAYHARENAALDGRLPQAYKVLGLLAQNIRIFNLDIKMGSKIDNPFHVSTTYPGYEDEWHFMFGRPSPTQAPASMPMGPLSSGP